MKQHGSKLIMGITFSHRYLYRIGTKLERNAWEGVRCPAVFPAHARAVFPSATTIGTLNTKWNATSPNAHVRVEGTGKNDGLYLNLFPMGFPSPITKTKHKETKTKNLAGSSRLSLPTSAVVFVQLTPPKTILLKYTPVTVLHPWSLQRKIPFDFERSMQC